MKLYKIIIKTHGLFGIVMNIKYVLARSKERAKDIMFQYPEYNNDRDARIIEIIEVDINKEGII